MQVAIAEAIDRQPGLEQFDFMAVGETHRLAHVVDAHAAFGGEARVGHVLQLRAIDRLGYHADAFDQPVVQWPGRNRQAHQHRHGVGRPRRWRVAAAVLDVAVLAGIGVEQRAQAVARGGGGRCDHPGVAEKAVADAEVQAPGRHQVGRGLGKRFAILAPDRGIARRQRFAGLGWRRRAVAGTQA
jgi:hypothetical protein